MEFGFPGHVLTLDSILEGILQDESTSSSSSDSSRPTHLSLDNIPDALPIKEEKEEGSTVDIMVRFLLAQKFFGIFGIKLFKLETCPKPKLAQVAQIFLYFLDIKLFQPKLAQKNWAFWAIVILGKCHFGPKIIQTQTCPKSKFVQILIFVPFGQMSFWA